MDTSLLPPPRLQSVRRAVQGISAWLLPFEEVMQTSPHSSLTFPLRCSGWGDFIQIQIPQDRHWTNISLKTTGNSHLSDTQWRLKYIHNHSKVEEWRICALFSFLTESQDAHTASGATPEADAEFLQCSCTRNQILLNTTGQFPGPTHRLPILSSRSLSSLRLRRSWFLFSCFSATVFYGKKNKSTSYFSHTVTAIIYSHTVTSQICRKTIPIARQGTISLHFMC